MANWFRRHRGDEGFAMVPVLAIGAVAATLTAATLVSTGTTMRRSLADKQREQAIQLAEAGLHQAIAALTLNSATVTSGTPPTPITKTWVLDAASSLGVASAREGEFTYVIPTGGTHAYGVGYVPSRANAAATRVIELRLQFVVSTGNAGLVSGGQTTMTGNAIVSNGGGVHANGDLLLDGSANVSGSASSGGTITTNGSSVISGTRTSGTQPVGLTLDPLSFRAQTQYDLCPDGTIRNTAATACTGTLYAIGGGLGWDWKFGQWERQGSGGDGSGFFAHQTNVELKGTWTGLIVTNPLVANGVRLNGDVRSNGNVNVSVAAAADAATAIVSGRDVILLGNTTITGDIFALEQVDLSGNTLIHGQVTAVSSGNSAGSPVTTSALYGDVEIRYRTTTLADDSGVAPSSWNELR